MFIVIQTILCYCLTSQRAACDFSFTFCVFGPDHKLNGVKTNKKETGKAKRKERKNIYNKV